MATKAPASASPESVDISAGTSSISGTESSMNGVNESANSGEIPLTLDEFCTRLSSSDSRVELIGAFHFVEARAGKTKDVESAYAARFNAFINQPA